MHERQKGSGPANHPDLRERVPLHVGSPTVHPRACQEPAAGLGVVQHRRVTTTQLCQLTLGVVG